MSNALVAVLARASRGQASFTELAAALNAHDTLWGIPSAQQVNELLAAANDPGARATGPIAFNGIRTAEGEFGGLLFTDDDRAAAYGRSNGLADAEGGVPVASVPPLDGVVRCLVHGWDGLVLDAGTDHAVSLELSSVKRLYASMTRDALARRPELHAVYHQERLLVMSEGDERYAFVYEDSETAAAGVARQGHGVTAVARPTGALLEELRGSGMTRLLVDPKSPLQRGYDRNDLEAMIVAARGGAANATGAVLRARVHPPVPMVAPRGARDTDGRAALHALRASIKSGARPGWQLMEALAFEHDVHVPLDPRLDDGLLWPQVIGEGENTAVGAWTSAELATFMLSTNGPDFRRFEHLAGIEALRWIYAAPRRPRKIYVDLTIDAKDTQVVDAHDALLVFFPLLLNVYDLNGIPRVGLGKLGALPGARGLKAEVARALVQGARTLVSLAGPNGAPPAPVAHGAGRYLPAFTDADQFFAFTSRGPAGAKPQRSASGSPFAEWLSATVDVDGVLLDPAGPAPLVLSHADLLVLALWSEGRQPRGADLMGTLASLQAMNELPGRLVGRIAAEWPALYVLCPRGDRNKLLAPRGRMAGAIFTSLEAAQKFVEAGCCAEPAEAGGFFPRWAHSPFERLLLERREAWVDPDLADGGLRLDEAALVAAVEVLNERLQPRVPWFEA